MTAEPIARVIADLRAGRVRTTLPAHRELHQKALQLAQPQQPVVDATAIYHSIVAKDKPVYLYEDHQSIAPPWPAAAFCYANEHGNVLVMQSTATDWPQGRRRKLWKPAEPVDWQQVRWTIDTFVWLGGRSNAQGGAMATAGPAHLWRSAVYADGRPADLQWTHLVPEYPMERWDMAQLVLLGSLDFLNCRNVDIVEPVRERHERRRIARLGVQVTEINVFPTGASTRSADGKRPATGGVPLRSVRGHFAKYGPQYDRGLLFGKLTGRFWIPTHAVGAKQPGQSDDTADYRLVP